MKPVAIIPVLLMMLATGACTGENSSEPANSVAGRQSVEAAISIVFSQPGYSYTVAQAAEGIAIEYEIVIDRDLTGVVPLPQGSAGEGITVAQADGREERIANLLPFESLTGNAQSYGLFDTGLPAPRKAFPATIKSGRYRHLFKWNGRNWNGGSDTDRPQGDPFPAGTYKLEVSCAGVVVDAEVRSGFRVVNEVEVMLTD